MTKQNNNRRSNTLITHDGRTQTLAEWSREVGVPPKTLRHRIKAGWEIGKALFAKVSQSENSRWSAAA
jgi:lambda repressor-like predicted transcriptional regulator